MDAWYGLLWWVRHILLVLVGAFFLAFGIQLLKAAYGLNDPFFFILTFFASNLVILISATLILGFVLRMVRVYKALKATEEQPVARSEESTDHLRRNAHACGKGEPAHRQTAHENEEGQGPDPQTPGQ